VCGIRLKLGQLLRRGRESANLRQHVLALRAQIAQGDISRIENGLGGRGPTFETLVRLAHAQNMNLVVQLVPRGTKADDPELLQDLREAF